MIEPTAREHEMLLRVRKELDRERYPESFRVSREDIETYLTYMERCQQDVYARRKLGTLDEHEPTWFRWVGAHGGPMYKNVELVPDDGSDPRGIHFREESL